MRTPLIEFASTRDLASSDGLSPVPPPVLRWFCSVIVVHQASTPTPPRVRARRGEQGATVPSPERLEVAAKNDFGNALYNVAKCWEGDEEVLMRLVDLLMGRSEDSKIVARCALQFGKTFEWLNGGEVDLGKWKGVIAEGDKATKLEWSGLEMKGPAPVELRHLGTLGELWLCERHILLFRRCCRD